MFKQFLDGLGIRRLGQVTHSVIDKYIAYMREVDNPRFGRTGLSDSTISRRLAAVSSYFDYVRATSNPKLRNPLDDLVQRWKYNNEPKPVDDLTAEKLLDGITVERDRVLIGLFLATGLRVSEMHSLDRDTIKFELEVDESGHERVTGVGQVLGKGRKRRRFYVDEETLELYAQYLSSRTDQNSALFLSERKQRMSVAAIQYTLRVWCQRLGIPHINVHRLRHSFATSMANANINSMVLKRPHGTQQPRCDGTVLQAQRHHLSPRLSQCNGISAAVTLIEDELWHQDSLPVEMGQLRLPPMA